MVSKAKLRKRAKRATIKKKYADLKAAKSKRVDDRVSYIGSMQPPEDVEFNEYALTRKFSQSLNRYKNKKLMER